MPFGALPHRHEMQQMDALVSHSVLDASFTRQFDAASLEQRTVVGGVLHLD
jgi:hypothetical protein